MRWFGAEEAEVVRRVNNATAEMVLPNAIDDDTREQLPGTAINVCHPQSQAVARIRRRRF